MRPQQQHVQVLQEWFPALEIWRCKGCINSEYETSKDIERNIDSIFQI